jgi:DNA-binding transcriptional regulator YdaS (Cro superfamily)
MSGIQAAIKKAGGIQQLAKLIGISYQAVHKWTKPKVMVPAERVLQIERATGVSRHQLRSDLYPRESA